MIGFLRAFESAAFGIGMAAATSGGRPATRTKIIKIKQTSRGTIDRLIAALATARAERDAAVRRAAALERQVAILLRDRHHVG